jgi:hypothetical protein
MVRTDIHRRALVPKSPVFNHLGERFQAAPPLQMPRMWRTGLTDL